MPNDPWCQDPPDSLSASESASESANDLPRLDPTSLRYASVPQANCYRRWTRLAITGMIREHLTAAFQGQPFLDPTLRRAIWGNDDRSEGLGDGKILIESWYRWRPAKSGQMPALIVKPGRKTRERMGYNDQAGSSAVGHPRYATLWTGSHTVFALSQLGPTVEVLADTAAEALDHFGPQIRSGLGLYDFQVVSVGEIAEVADGPPEALGVPIDIGWMYWDVWRVEYESVRLREIRLSGLTDGLFGPR